MKNLLLLLCVSALLFSSCKKDDIDDKSNKLIGTWQVTQITPHNTDLSQLKVVVFNYGTYEFRRDNTFTYTNLNNEIITGTWTINRRSNKECDDCSQSYVYSLSLDSDATKNNFGQGFFSDVRIYSTEVSGSQYIEGVNRRFEFRFRKK